MDELIEATKEADGASLARAINEVVADKGVSEAEGQAILRYMKEAEDAALAREVAAVEPDKQFLEAMARAILRRPDGS